MFLKRLGTLVVITALVSGCCRGKSFNHCAVRDTHAKSEQCLFNQDLVPAPISLTLEDCIEIALNRNLELQVKAWEASVQREIAFRETWRILPTLEAEYNNKGRNTSPGVSSKSLIPTIPPAPPSVSSEKNTQTTRYLFTWNLLDFGISYHLAQQEKNRTLILSREYERLRQNLVLSVVEEFWKAAATKEVAEKFKDLDERSEEQRNVLNRLIDQSILPEIASLDSQDEMLDVILDLKEFQRLHFLSMQKLTELLGLSPNQQIVLVVPELSKNLPEIGNMAYLEERALRSRPELFAKDLEEVISYHDVRIAILNMFPGVSFFSGYDRNSNVYLVKRSWLSAGFNIAKDLLSLPAYNQERIRAMHAKYGRFADRIRTSLGVVTQLHLAAIDYQEHADILRTFAEKSEVRNRMVEAARKSKVFGQFHDFEVTQYELEALYADALYRISYGETMTSLEKINNAVGIPLLIKPQSSLPKERDILEYEFNYDYLPAPTNFGENA